MKITVSIDLGRAIDQQHADRIAEQPLELKTLDPSMIVDDEPRKPPEQNLPVHLTDKIGNIIPWEKPDPNGYELDMVQDISPATVMTRMLQSDEGKELLAKYDLSMLGSVRGLVTMAYKTRPFTVYIKKGT